MHSHRLECVTRVVATAVAVALVLVAVSFGATSAQAQSDGDQEVRIAAQRLANGRTEFALQARASGSEWGTRMLPASRFLSAGVRTGRWYASSLLTVGGLTLRIAAQPLSNGRIEFAVQQRASNAEWGERLLPTSRFMPANAAAGRWLYSSPVALPGAPDPPSTSTAEPATDSENEPATDADQPRPDPQAERVYAWESRMLRAQLGDLPSAAITIEDAQTIVDAIFADHFEGSEDAPEVLIASLPSGIAGRSDGQTIELDRQSIRLDTLLHETAHAIFLRGTDGTDACHCPEWAAQMLALWDRYVVGFDVDAAGASAVSAGVSVAEQALIEPTGDSANLGRVRVAIAAAFTDRLDLFPEPPSRRNVLGYADAPVTILEYSDYI